MRENISAIQRYVNRLFAYSYKFQCANTVAINPDTGHQSTTSGYNTEPLKEIGSVGGADKPQHGSSRIQLCANGQSSIPIDIGENPWHSG